MPTRKALIFTAAALVAGTGGALLAARHAVGELEAMALARVESALLEQDGWIELSASGAVLNLSGEAPNPKAQIEALARIGGAAAGLWIEDQTTAAEFRTAAPMARPSAEEDSAEAPAAPVSYRVDILRNGPLVTLFGDAPPAQTGPEGLAAQLGRAGEITVTDMLAAVPGETGPAWDESLAFALEALDLFERVRITVEPGTVTLSGSVRSIAARQAALESLATSKPERVRLSTDLSVPREVIAPFVFRARLDEGVALQVTACTAETEKGLDRILEAAAALGGAAECRVGLGAPSPEWGRAVSEGLAALGKLGSGTLDISDADIALTGSQGMAAASFDETVNALRGALPEGFSLSAALPPEPEPEEDADTTPPPVFTAVRTEDGAVRLRGDVPDAQLGETAKTLAEAQFGFDSVINETSIRPDLPAGWAARVIGGLEGLGMLHTGQLEVSGTELRLTGTTPSDEVQDELRALLAGRLPPDEALQLDIWTEEQLVVEPVTVVPAVLCAEQISVILGAGQIGFPPGETSIDAGSLPIVDRIAQVLSECPGARFEIGGHTDSQGSEGGNMALSQARADAVLAALLERGVDTVFLYARGYGETTPIADNETEEGRAANRRIEFSLLPEEDNSETGEGAGGEAAEVLHAEGAHAAEESGIETSRGESPTVIVVPQGTDPASVLPPSAQAEADAQPAENPEATPETAATAAGAEEPAPADSTAEATGADAIAAEPEPEAEPDPNAPMRPRPRPDSMGN